MALKLADKQQIVEEIKSVATQSVSLVAAEYRGLTSVQLTSLRKEAKNSGVFLKVVRNTLASRALADTDYACTDEKLVGPLILAFSLDDPGAAARLFKNFAKSNEKLKTTAISLGGKLLAANQLDAIASLPTYDQAVGQLLSVMQAPIVKFVRTLAEPYTRLVRTIAAIRDQKQKG